MTTNSASHSSTRPPRRLLLVATHSPWEHGDARDFLQLAATLAGSGAGVHLHLIQNAVLWLQHENSTLTALCQRHGERLRLSFDDFSLDQRGIPHAAACAFGDVRTMDALVAEMAEVDVKTIWHS